MKQITIKNLKQPLENDVNEDIDWFCESLGIFGERDKNKTSVSIFKKIINDSFKGKNASVDSIAEEGKISRTTVMHHINVMKDAGLVVKEGTFFELRARSLQKIVDEIELDIERTLNSIRKIAEDIDNEMALPVRPKKE